MNIENIAIKNAQKVKLYDISKITSIDEAELYINYKNGKVSFIHNEECGERVILVKNKLNFDLDTSVNFCIKLNVHDTCTEEGTLTFGNKSEDLSVLFPDLYQLHNYFDSLKKDNVSFDDKINKVIFAGSTTGESNAMTNTRIKMCLWALDKSFCYFKITSLVQMSFFPRLKEISSNFISQEEQLNYKYILSIDGNTNAWDRPVWIMNSNSVLLKYTNSNTHNGWYYPLLKENEHFISVTENNIEDKYLFLENNYDICHNIINNANNFVKTYCSEEAYMVYIKTLYENIDI